MLGRKPDPNIREPFLWGDAHAGQQTRWMTPTYSTPTAVRPAALQAQDPASLHAFYRALIALRNASPVLTRGEIAPANVADPAVASFLRTEGRDTLWVAHNLSGHAVTVAVPPALRHFTRLRYRSVDAVLRTPTVLTLPPYSSAAGSGRR